MAYSWKDIVDKLGFTNVKELHRKLINKFSLETKELYDDIVVSKHKDDNEAVTELQNEFEIKIAKAKFLRMFVDKYEREVGS